MSAAELPARSLRIAQVESSRLVWAFVLSLVFHLLLWGGYTGGKRVFSWMQINRPGWLLPLKLLHRPSPPPKKPAEPPVLTLNLTPPPLAQYVDVSPAQAASEPPKNPKFVSSRNSQAANPDIDKESDVPKISGERPDLLKADDVPRQDKVALQPIVPPAEPSPQEQPEEKPKPKPAPGDMTVAKAEPSPQKEDGQSERPRPRTIKEALARLPNTSIPGRKMKQSGGVRRRLEISAMDARATLFGAYQERLVAAIVQRWYDLLDERAYTMENGGKVIVRFSVHYDGTVTGVTIGGNTTGAEVLGYVCVKAIEDPAPYEAWPSDMRHEIARGVFDVEFTFIY
jgi:outer membrane biosynthesis protein TonB